MVENYTVLEYRIEYIKNNSQNLFQQTEYNEEDALKFIQTHKNEWSSFRLLKILVAEW